MIRAYSFSAAGGHAVNEDAFALQPLGNTGYLICLADGQGGRAGGAAAAQLACRVALEHATTQPHAWEEALTRADEAVAADREAGFTTLVGLGVEGDRVRGASCGDSAALAVWRDTAPRVLTSRQFKNLPVGSGEATFIPFEAELVRPWRILVMSDGVWKYASWDRVWDLSARLSGEELLTELQDAARLKSTGEFPDDFTVVLLESDE
jgi:PPM family protein phosphatase